MKIDYYNEIKARYGNIKRAKGFYLYTEKNIRLLDLYLDNGMSILGRRQNQSPLIAKQFIDRGLTAFLPTKADYNLQKALNALFPNHSEFRIYSSYSECIEALNAFGIKKPIDIISFYEENLWRAFLPERDSLLEQDAFFVQPAIASPFKILIFKKNIESAENHDSANTVNLPPETLMPAAEKASLARAFFDLAQKQEFYKKTEIITKSEGDGEYLRFTSSKRQRKQAEQSLKQYKQVKELSQKFWTIKGAYLFSKMDEAEYKEFFSKALDARVLISPDFRTPSFLPRMQNYTELLKLLNL